MPGTMNTSTPNRTVLTDASSPLRSSHLPSHFRVLSPFFRESYLTSEYCMLPHQPKIGGVYVIPAAQNPDLWFGVLFVHHGYYQGGVFRFTMKFPSEFPDTGNLPAVTFHPPVFHPLIHPTKGNFDLKRFFRSGWSKGGNHVWQVLKIIRTSFYKIDTNHPLDRHAAEQYENHQQNFAAKAKQEAELSKARACDEPPEAKDPHYIRFSEYDPKLHDGIRGKALRPYFDIQKTSIHTDDAAKKGLSFLNLS